MTVMAPVGKYVQLVIPVPQACTDGFEQTLHMFYRAFYAFDNKLLLIDSMLTNDEDVVYAFSVWQKV